MKNLIIFHCNSAYPTPLNDINLLAIKYLQDKFKCNVGYSGHENSLAVSYAASMMGITSLERHITLDRTMYGSDQAASLELRGMRELISVINKMQAACSSTNIHKISLNEIEIATKLRSHIKNYDAKKHLL